MDPILAEQLAKARPGQRLAVAVHGKTYRAAAEAIRATGLQEIDSWEKVQGALAVGTAASIERLVHEPGIMYLQGDRPLRLMMETAPTATRAEDALRGFSATRAEPRPDKPGKTRKECRRVKRNGRTSRVCRTVRGPSVPQPPILHPATSAPVDGSGVSIAIIDSGIDAQHPMFMENGVSRVLRNFQPACTDIEGLCVGSSDREGGHGNADDDFFVEVPPDAPPAGSHSPLANTDHGGGHGTHVAGIAGGGHVTTSDGHRLHGVAPGVKLFGFSSDIGINLLATSAALNWILEHHRQPCGPGVGADVCPPIRVVNNSYGPDGGGEYNAADSSTQIAEALADEGVVTVWAQGNDGGNGSQNLSNPPAQSPVQGILGVANYDDAGAGTRDGTLSPSSSRGRAGRRSTYPDLSAPGTDITSACGPTMVICQSFGADLDYGTISGTSMAAPHVAGAVAQLIQAGRQEGVELTPAQIEDILEDTAYKFTGGGAYEDDILARNDGTTSYDKGHGLIDAKTAVARVRNIGIEDAGSPVMACVGGQVMVDPPGDAADRTVDLLRAELSGGPAGVTASFAVADLVNTFPTTFNGYDFNLDFLVGGRNYFISGSRSIHDSAGSFDFGRPNPRASNVRDTLTSKGMSGSFDVGADRVTISFTQETIDAANAELATEDGEGAELLPSLGEGFVLSEVKGVTFLRRDAFAVAALTSGDTGDSGCQFGLSRGAAEPNSPPPAADDENPDGDDYQPGAPEATVGPGGTYTWRSAARTDAAVTGTLGDIEAITGLTPCDLSLQGCEERFIQLEVPASGSTLDVSITPTSPGTVDLDLYVLDPRGVEVGRSADEDSAESISVPVTRAGVYTVRLVHYISVQGTYEGKLSLR